MGNAVQRQRPSRRNSRIGMGPDTQLPSQTERLLSNALSQLYGLNRLLTSLCQHGRLSLLDWPSLEQAADLCSRTWMNLADALLQHQSGVYSPEELKLSSPFISEDIRATLGKSHAWVSPSSRIAPKLKALVVQGRK